MCSYIVFVVHIVIAYTLIRVIVLFLSYSFNHLANPHNTVEIVKKINSDDFCYFAGKIA